jgi:chemoreceptor-like protein with four helix bundle sensory module
MAMKPGSKDVFWMALGAVMLLVVVLVVLHVQRGQSPADQLAFKAKRVDLVERMRLALASASEAEKSAVMAITDEDSQKFADQARAATAEVDKGDKELGELLQNGGTANEKELLSQFSKVFTEFQGIDRDLLALAVKNTNIKAYSLAFGPAADAIQKMDAALDAVVSKSAAAPEARSVALLAFGAETAALRIQTLLAPHIAEESDPKMDELEARMTKEDQTIREHLDGLAKLPMFSGDTDLETATSSYADFTKIRTQILALSRENTNVRSLAISLNQKRKVMLLCQDALAALQQAILQEHIDGVNYGPPSNPR